MQRALTEAAPAAYCPPLAVRRFVAALLFAVLAARAGGQVGTAFTYQGRLSGAGAAPTGDFDFSFELFDAASAGNSVAGPLTFDGVAVSSGLFTLSLDFGAGAFAGNQRWLEIGVRPSGGGAYATLSPRQALTPAPGALFAEKAGDAARLGGQLPAAYFQVANVLGVTSGGTGAGDATGARANLQAAKSGANSDITSLSGLSTPLSVAQGGTGATTAAGARSALGAQAAILGGCPSGATINAVNSDGTLVCLSSSGGQPGFSIASIDASADVGRYSSIVIGSDGLGLISYYDADNRRLKVAHCSNPACSSATSSVVDDGGGVNDVGMYSSITIGGDGLGVVSYFDATAIALKVAHCNDVACSSATSVVVDTGAGEYSAISKSGSNGFPLVSYYHQGNRQVKLAMCKNPSCASPAPDLKVMDGNGIDVIGKHTSLTSSSGGLAYVSYFDETNGRLKLARCDNNLCNSPIVVVGDASTVTGLYTAIALGVDNWAVVAYQDASNNALKTAHAGIFLGGLTNATLPPLFGPAGFHNSIAIGSDGLPVIVYFEQTSLNLVVAYCQDVPCSSATMTSPDIGGDVGRYNSVAIGPDGFPLVSYYDATNKRLKTLHCNNVACSNNVARTR